MNQLDRYRNSSYQSKDIAHVQKTITQRIADKVQPKCLLYCCRTVRKELLGLPSQWIAYIKRLPLFLHE